MDTCHSIMDTSLHCRLNCADMRRHAQTCADSHRAVLQLCRRHPRRSGGLATALRSQTQRLGETWCYALSVLPLVRPTMGAAQSACHQCVTNGNSACCISTYFSQMSNSLRHINQQGNTMSHCGWPENVRTESLRSFSRSFPKIASMSSKTNNLRNRSGTTHYCYCDMPLVHNKITKNACQYFSETTRPLRGTSERSPENSDLPPKSTNFGSFAPKDWKISNPLPSLTR